MGVLTVKPRTGKHVKNMRIWDWSHKERIDLFFFYNCGVQSSSYAPVLAKQPFSITGGSGISLGCMMFHEDDPTKKKTKLTWGFFLEDQKECIKHFCNPLITDVSRVWLKLHDRYPLEANLPKFQTSTATQVISKPALNRSIVPCPWSDFTGLSNEIFHPCLPLWLMRS